MTIYGIGVDIVENARIRQSMDRIGEPFLNRVFTEKEREYCDAMKFPHRHYAARFAAKEAISKALGTGIGANLHWKDMEILRRGTGEPFVILYGAGKKYAADHKIHTIMISLTHTDQYSAANCVACVSDP